MVHSCSSSSGRSGSLGMAAVLRHQRTNRTIDVDTDWLLKTRQPSFNAKQKTPQVGKRE